MEGLLLRYHRITNNFIISLTTCIPSHHAASVQCICPVHPTVYVRHPVISYSTTHYILILFILLYPSHPPCISPIIHPISFSLSCIMHYLSSPIHIYFVLLYSTSISVFYSTLSHPSYHFLSITTIDYVTYYTGTSTPFNYVHLIYPITPFPLSHWAYSFLYGGSTLCSIPSDFILSIWFHPIPSILSPL